MINAYRTQIVIAPQRHRVPTALVWLALLLFTIFTQAHLTAPAIVPGVTLTAFFVFAQGRYILRLVCATALLAALPMHLLGIIAAVAAVVVVSWWLATHELNL